jgi:hypothetical protein
VKVVALLDQDVLVAVPDVTVFVMSCRVDWRVTLSFAHPLAIRLRKKFQLFIHKFKLGERNSR